jgi:hypothetical protein
MKVLARRSLPKSRASAFVLTARAYGVAVALAAVARRRDDLYSLD